MDSVISSNFTMVDQLSIHYLTAGEGETILLLHGWPTSAYLWRNIMPALAKTYRVVAMDLPGFGQSDKRAEDSFSFRYYARAISGLLENLGINKVTLGVHDLGGPLGLYWAVQDLNRVERLIFFNTLVYPEFSWAVKLFGLMTMLPGVRHWLSSSRGIKWSMKFGVHQKQKLTEEAIRNYQMPFRDQASRKALLKSVHNLTPKAFVEISQKLPDFKGPVQIIYGEKDRILPDVKKTMQRVQRELPQSSMVSLPDCGHFLQEEAPERISELIIDFLKSKK